MVSDDELKKLGESKKQNLEIISQYYVRDNRIFEIYFLLQVLNIYKFKKLKADRKEIEKNILVKTNTINNQNWRNAFISLSSLGFIDSKNYPTSIGARFAYMEFAEFAYMIFDSYLKPYYELIFKILQKNPNLKNGEICEECKKELGTTKEIYFLTESNARYMSSWLNVARDDFKIIDFEPRNSKRKILFDPFIASKNAFINHIERNTNYLSFKSDFERILSAI